MARGRTVASAEATGPTVVSIYLQTPKVCILMCFVSHESLAPKIDFPTGDSTTTLQKHRGARCEDPTKNALAQCGCGSRALRTSNFTFANMPVATLMCLSTSSREGVWQLGETFSARGFRCFTPSDHIHNSQHNPNPRYATWRHTAMSYGTPFHSYKVSLAQGRARVRESHFRLSDALCLSEVADFPVLHRLEQRHFWDEL